MHPSPLENSGPRILARMEQLLEWAHFPAETNFEIAKHDLIRLLDFAQRNSVWWRSRMQRNFGKIHDDLNFSEILKRIPITTRQDLQVWGKLAHVKIGKGLSTSTTEFVTSGSTGLQTRGVKHAETYAINSLAFALMEFKWFDRSLDKNRFHLGFRKIDTEGDLAFPYNLLGPTRGKNYAMSYVSRTNQEVLAAMEDKPAHYFVAPGNIAEAIARQVLADGRKISYEQVLCFADPVTSVTRDLIQRAFGARVIDRYSTEEIGPIALQCPQADHLHVIEPLVHVEILNNSNQSVLCDEIGRVVVTDLHSYAMPILRYELGDLANWDLEPCPAGITWPAIKQVVGRTRDGVRDANGEFRPVTFYKMPWENWEHFVDSYVVMYEDLILAFVNMTRPLTPDEHTAIGIGLNKAFYSEKKVQIVEDVDLTALSPIKRLLYTKIDRCFNPADSITDIFQQVLAEQQKRVNHVVTRYENGGLDY